MNRILTLLILCACLAQVKAQTNVFGGIFSNTTWTANNSPYILTGPIVVFPGNTLTIEPGVTVKVKANGNNTGEMAYIELRGSLIANGTIQNPIKFIPEIPTTDFTWRGIEIKSKQGGTFTANNFELANTLYGINSDKIYSDTLTFNNCTFRNNMYGHMLTGPLVYNNCSFINNGVVCAANIQFGSATVNNCYFEGNTVCFTTMANGVFLNNSFFTKSDRVIMASPGEIINCNFTENGTGLDNCYGIKVINSNFNNNGIAISGANMAWIENNVIVSNDVGIEISGPSTIINNEINANKVGVVLAGMFEPGSTIPSFTNNRICFNSSYNVENKSDLNLGLEKNCFCSPDSAFIESTIYDGYDNFTRGLINFATYDTSCAILLKTIKKVNITSYVKEIKGSKSIQIYPNPANDFMQLSTSDDTLFDGTFQVYNGLGTIQLELKATKQKQLEVDISNLPTGIYWISNGNVSKSFLKQ